MLIHEHDRDNWAIGGELLSERRGAQKDTLPDLDALFRKPVKSPRLSRQPESHQQNRDHGDKAANPDRGRQARPRARGCGAVG